MHDQSYVDDQISKAVKFVNEDKFNEAEQIVESLVANQDLKDFIKLSHLQNIAEIYLSLGKFKLAANTYLMTDNPAGTAFSYVLLKEIDKAKQILATTPDSPAKFWCQYLCELFSGHSVKNYPSFLEIRHFLEVTVYLLLRSNNQPYINLIIKNLKKLLDINVDSEKLVGYAYFHFGDLNNAELLLKNSVKRSAYDGEVFFMLGKLYLQKGLVSNALSMLENSSLLLPEHYPTQELLKKVKSMI